MKKAVALLLILVLLLGGCGTPAEEEIVPNHTPITSDPIETPEQTPQEPPEKTPEETPETEPEITPEKTSEQTPEKEPETTPETVPEQSPPAEEPVEQQVTLKCLTFNVLAYCNYGGNFESAKVRGEASLAFLKKSNCDIIGLQEAVDARGLNWIPAGEVFDFDTYFREGLGGTYAFSGVNESEVNGEGLIILYRKSRFDLLDSGAFEFSTNTDSYYHWVKLYDKLAAKTIFVVNTHLSPNRYNDYVWGHSKRMTQSVQLAQFFNSTVKNAPLIATGDYNCKLDDPQYAGPHLNLQKSGKFFPSVSEAYDSDASTDYDYIYFNVNQMICDRHDQVPQEYTLPSGKTLKMSDHYPIRADFTYL